MLKKPYWHIVCAFALSLISVAASAQCENENAALQTAAQMKQEIASVEKNQKAALAEVFAAFDAKAAQLGWSKTQQAEFLKKIELNGKYVLLRLQLQQQQLIAIGVKEELAAKGVQDDPIRVCTIGLKFGPIFKQIAKLNEELVEYMNQKVAEAK